MNIPTIAAADLFDYVAANKAVLNVHPIQPDIRDELGEWGIYVTVGEDGDDLNALSLHTYGDDINTVARNAVNGHRHLRDQGAVGNFTIIYNRWSGYSAVMNGWQPE